MENHSHCMDCGVILPPGKTQCKDCAEVEIRSEEDALDAIYEDKKYGS